MKSQNLQFVWFPVSATSLSADRILEALFGVAPDSTQMNRLPTAQAPFLSQASYSDESVSYVVQVLPGRVNLVLQPSDGGSATQEIKHAPLIDYESNFQRVVKCILKMPSGLIGDCLRVSVIPNLAWPRESQAEANRIFSKLTSVKVKDDSRDLIFQFNDRATIVQGIGINRIHNFGVAEIQMVQFQLGQGIDLSIGPSGSTVGYIANDALDFNTVPDGRILSETLQKSIFENLGLSVSLAVESMQIGSIK